MADSVVYRSRVRIERVRGSLRRAYLPAEQEPTLFGVHSEIAQHYGVDPTIHTPHATTLITLLQRLRDDSPGPLGARWRRADYRPVKDGFARKRPAMSNWKGTCWLSGASTSRTT